MFRFCRPCYRHVRRRHRHFNSFRRLRWHFGWHVRRHNIGCLSIIIGVFFFSLDMELHRMSSEWWWTIFPVFDKPVSFDDNSRISGRGRTLSIHRSCQVQRLLSSNFFNSLGSWLIDFGSAKIMSCVMCAILFIWAENLLNSYVEIFYRGQKNYWTLNGNSIVSAIKFWISDLVQLIQ